MFGSLKPPASLGEQALQNKQWPPLPDRSCNQQSNRLAACTSRSSVRQSRGCHLSWNEALYRFARRRPQLTRDPAARRQQRIRACYTSLLVGSLQLNTSGRILGWTPNEHSANVCLASCVYAAAHIGRSIGKNVLWDPPPLLRPDSPPRCSASVLDGGTLSTVHSTS